MCHVGVALYHDAKDLHDLSHRPAPAVGRKTVCRGAAARQNFSRIVAKVESPLFFKKNLRILKNRNAISSGFSNGDEIVYIGGQTEGY